MSEYDKSLREIEKYYSDKIKVHGPTPKGVDWNGEESQRNRFNQIASLITASEFRLMDIGCGYGAFFSYLRHRFKNFTYLGIDISQEMLNKAIEINQDKNAQFCIKIPEDHVVDYCVASGIFNVKLDSSEKSWLDYIYSTLDLMSKCSLSGFAFNCLTSYSDSDKKKDYLYYANPNEIFHFCKINLSRNVALLHDYNLYEFTIIVRK